MMTKEQFELAKETEARLRALDILKNDLDQSSAFPFCLKFGYHKEYLLGLMHEKIDAEIRHLNLLFGEI